MTQQNLPSQPTPLVGRVEELAEITALLGDPACQLLTLVGPGGIGKTRLAIEVSKQMQDNFADGVYFVNLQPVVSSSFLVSSIADSLNVPLQGHEDPQTPLLGFLHNKELLIVLDNFEHLLDEGDFLAIVLKTASGIRFLVTSREVLNLQEEWLYTVQGLDYPDIDDPNDMHNYSAVQLFIERTRHVRRNFSFADERQGVNRICRTLQGMPLAIELAAPWTKALTCMEIADEIQRSLDFLATSLRNVPERHRSMQAVFKQSWSMLSDQEGTVFRRLSVFRSGFSREAAAWVASASIDNLTSFVDKSLLVWGHDRRYQIHELLRQYAEQKLAEIPGDMKQVRDLHTTYYTDFVHEREDALHGGQQIRATIELSAELENIRVAWQWAVEHVKVEAISNAAHGLQRLYNCQSRYLEGADAFAGAVDCLVQSDDDGLVLAKVLVDQSWMCLRLGQIGKAKAACERSLAIYKRLNAVPPATEATDPLTPLSIVAVVMGDYKSAYELGEQARQHAEARGDTGNLLFAYYALAGAALAQGDYQTAKQFAQNGCALAEAREDPWMSAYCLNQLGEVTSALGSYVEARQHYQASYVIREEHKDAEGMALALNHLGEVAWLEGDYYEAKRLYQLSLNLYQDLGDRGGLANTLVGLGRAACILGEYPAASRHLHDALQTALEAHLVPLALSILINIGELLVKINQRERAVQLFAVALYHLASDYETKEKARQFLASNQRTEDRPSEITENGVSDHYFLTITASLLKELSTAETTTIADTSGQANSALVDLLSARELEILRLVAVGLSNREIAEQFVLAESTVKWYLNEIFSKLHVKSRTQALHRAKELSLLQ